jgi:cytochrome P450
MRRDLVGFFGEVATHGDVAGFHVWRQPVVLLNHPDLIRDVLVTNQKNFRKGIALERARMLLGDGLLTSEGEFHLRQRRLAQPAFHRDRIAHYADAMTERAVQLRDTWTDGATVDAHRAMMVLTLAIVGRTLFDADVERDASAIGRALTDVLRAFDFAQLPFAETLQRLPLPQMIRFRRGRARLREAVHRLIVERRASVADRGDLLSMLLMATDDQGDGHGMTDEQLRDEVMTLMLAGHETTANALTWTWYLLAERPDVETRLHAEVDALGHPPSFDDLPRLEYTRRVIAESMRLFPPAYAIGRRAINAFNVGGYTVPARALVMVSQFVQHRDPRWYDDPERFDPDRWSADEVAKRPKFSYFPFGAGTRVCIGEQFAWIEAVIVLATLAQAWRLRMAPGQEIAAQARITLRPRSGIQMLTSRRDERV